MKLIYTVILFLVFFNIFSFMIVYMDIIPYGFSPDDEQYDVNVTGDTIPGESTFKELTGFNVMQIIGIFFGDLSSVGGVLATIAIIGIASVAAWLTHSAAPFVVAFLGNIVRVTYVNSMGVMTQFEINPYINLAISIGICFLIVITAAEYLTHGDA